MRKKLKLILKIAVTVVVLGVIISLVPLKSVWAELKSIALPPFFLGAAILVTIRCFMAMRTAVLAAAQGLEISTRRLFEISLIASFYSFFLPGSLSAGAVRWYKISKSAPGSSGIGAFSTVAFDRFVDTGIIVAIGLTFVGFDVAKSDGNHTPWTILFITLFLFTCYWAAFSTWPYRLLEKFLDMAGWMPGRIQRIARDIVRSAGLFSAMPTSAHLRIVALSLLKDGLSIFAYYLFARSVSLDLDLITIAWVRSATMLVIMLPISVSGLGVREGSMVAFLAPYGVGPAAAIAFSLVTFAGSLGLVIVGGLFEAREFFADREAASGAPDRFPPPRDARADPSAKER